MSPSSTSSLSPPNPISWELTQASFGNDSLHQSKFDSTLGSNVHGMVTRSKVGIFKPRVLLSSLDETKPKNVKGALSHPQWSKAMQKGYDDLMRNNIL